MKAALISGGGSRGTFGIGQAEKLGNDYDVFYGWSTGALIAPLWALGEFETLKYLYFNTENKDIFNVYPFNKKGKLNVLKCLFRFLIGKQTLGEMIPLRDQIDKNFTIEKWNALQESGKEVIIGASNIKSKTFEVKYFSSKTETYEDFKLAMWASACPPIFGSLTKIQGVQYADAGTIEILNFKNAIEKGATHIDAIIHRTANNSENNYITDVNTISDYIGRLLPTLGNNCPSEVIKLGKEWAESNGCNVNLIYMPFPANFTSFQFDPVKMKQLYLDTI